MNHPRITLLLLIVCLLSIQSRAQEISQYDRFQLQEGELYWQHNYICPGNADSVNMAVEKMLKSQGFTFNVVRGKDGFSGKINHYQVNPKRYGRTYTNTPRMYWDGEWSGKFLIEVGVGHYQVTIYELQFKSETQAVGHYRPEKVRTGKYIDAVTASNKQSFLQSEFINLSMISLSFKDNFDLTGSVENSK
jgi:hypothetical protein